MPTAPAMVLSMENGDKKILENVLQTHFVFPLEIWISINLFLLGQDSFLSPLVIVVGVVGDMVGEHAGGGGL